MSRKPPRREYLKGKSRTIIESILINGCLPSRAVKYIADNESTFKRQLWLMKKRGDLVKINRDGTAVYIFPKPELNAKLEKEIKKENPKLYEFYKSDGIKRKHLLNQAKGENCTYKNVIRQAECEIFFRGCGFKSRFYEREFSDIANKINAYYSPKELKIDLEDDVTNISNSDVAKNRSGAIAKGMISTKNGDNMLVYYFGSVFPPVNYKEVTLREFVNAKLVALNQHRIKDCVIMVTDTAAALKITRPVYMPQKYSLSAMKDMYEHLFLIALTSEGQKHIKIMSEPMWQEKLNEVILPDVSKSEEAIDCDGTDGESYYLNFCIPDIKKLENFILTATAVTDVTANKYQFKIICFEYQTELVKSLVNKKSNIEIYSVSIDEYIDGYTSIGKEPL